MTKQPYQMPQPLGLYAGELLERANDYFTSFERLHASQGRELRYPMYFLLAHGVELLMKAHLAATGKTKRELHKLDHRLEDIFAACSQEFRAVTHASDLIERLAEMNRHHDFRYPSGYVLSVPPPNDCLVVVRELLGEVTSAIHQAHFKAQLQLASETSHLKGRKIQWSD